jgi:hypothetical protein
MVLISATVGLPLLPVRGVLALARTIQQQAEQERSSPAALRRRLEAVEQAHADDADPESARHEAEQVEQVLGGVISPTTIMPDTDTDADADADAGDR